LNVNPQLAALIGVLALTARVLLLLARLLAAALLLAGLLTGGLVLLTRILVRIAHSDTPLLVFTGATTDPGGNGCGNAAGCFGVIPRLPSDDIVAGEPPVQTTYVQAL
jgi:hypothetical protein